MTILPGRLFALAEDDLTLAPVGFAPEDSLLPVDARTFDGYRLLREYAILPQRFMFLRLCGRKLAEFISRCEQDTFDLVFLLDRSREE